MTEKGIEALAGGGWLSAASAFFGGVLVAATPVACLGLGAVGAIGFGIYEVSTGVGAVDGAKNIFSGLTVIGGGILVLLT